MAGMNTNGPKPETESPVVWPCAYAEEMSQSIALISCIIDYWQISPKQSHWCDKPSPTPMVRVGQRIK